MEKIIQYIKRTIKNILLLLYIYLYNLTKLFINESVPRGSVFVK